MKRNDWQKKFGAARRAADKALLEAAERAIALEEVAARKLAAEKMGLVKDTEGRRLPDDLWRQCEEEAKRRIAALQATSEPPKNAWSQPINIGALFR